MDTLEQIKKALGNFIDEEIANGVRKDKAVINSWIETIF